MTGNKSSDQSLYHQLAYYTLEHKDPQFIHQNVVDAFAAQTADANTKPITLTFALVGLYLFLEKGYTGKQVQLAHMKMARVRKSWPKFDLPADRGHFTIKDVLAFAPGPDRDLAIRKWCEVVWGAYRSVHEAVASVANDELDVSKT